MSREVDVEELIEHVRALPLTAKEKLQVLETLAKEYGIEITEEHKRKALE